MPWRRFCLGCMRLLETNFRKTFGVSLFSHEIDDAASMQHVSRFSRKDQASLLRLAKDLVRIFTDRLDERSLRKLSEHPDKDNLKSNKLLQSILAQKVGGGARTRGLRCHRRRLRYAPWRRTPDKLEDRRSPQARRHRHCSVVSAARRAVNPQLRSRHWCTGSSVFGGHEKNEE